MAVKIQFFQESLRTLAFTDLLALTPSQWKLVLEAVSRSSLEVALSSLPDSVRRDLEVSINAAGTILTGENAGLTKTSDAEAAQEKVLLEVVRLIEDRTIDNPWTRIIVYQENAQWSKVLAILMSKGPRSQVEAWISPLVLRKWDTGQLVLEAPNEFIASWVVDHFKEWIQSVAEQVTGSKCELAVTVTGDVAERGSVASLKNGLITRLSFDSFVVGSDNRFALAAALAVAERTGRQYSPLLIHGPSGIGKTHLLHAIGNRSIAVRSSTRILYVSAESLVNELIESIQDRRMSQFRNKYRDSIDMLLIDDIQFIAGKTTSEEELLHILNALLSFSCQIVISCDRHPRDVEGLDERLRTRFEWGLVTEIGVPETETRMAIIRAAANENRFSISDEAAAFLASSFSSSVGELQGALNWIQARAALMGEDISLKTVKREFGSDLRSINLQVAEDNDVNRS